MHRIFRPLALATITASLFASSALAAEDYISFRAGAFDVGSAFEAAHFGLEYRGVPMHYNLSPIVGIEGNVDAGIYAYAGLAYDWNFTGAWSLVPSLAIGAYDEGDDSRDLGGVFEIRTGLELDYTLANQHRVGLALHHISNAGIYDENPGTETLMVSYSLPLN